MSVYAWCPYTPRFVDRSSISSSNVVKIESSGNKRARGTQNGSHPHPSLSFRVAESEGDIWATLAWAKGLWSIEFRKQTCQGHAKRKPSSPFPLLPRGGKRGRHLGGSGLCGWLEWLNESRTISVLPEQSVVALSFRIFAEGEGRVRMVFVQKNAFGSIVLETLERQLHIALYANIMDTVLHSWNGQGQAPTL